ncbi:DUF5668 domain-containing protein [Lachnospiraceae bacterium ZAX-1]
MRIRRVGSATCGVLLVFFGILFFVHMVWPNLAYTDILKLWPLVLIGLGVEILVGNFKKDKNFTNHTNAANVGNTVQSANGKTETLLKYDVGAIVLTIVLALFAMGMGITEFCINHTNFYQW